MTRFDILFLCTDNNAKSRAGLEALHKAGYELLVLVYEIPLLRRDPKRPRELYIKPRWHRRHWLKYQSSSVYSHDNGIAYFITHETDLQSLLPVLQQMEFDYVVVNGWPAKLPSEIRALAKLETMNCHSSCLPAYRGGNITYAPLINREETSGITVHVLTDKLDAGPIITQLSFDIDRNETTRSLTFKRSLYIGEALMTALRNIQERKPYAENPPSTFWRRQSYPSYLAYRAVNAVRRVFRRAPLRRQPAAVRLIDRF